MRTTKKIISAVILLGVGACAGYFIPLLSKPEPIAMDHSMDGAMKESVTSLDKLEGEEFDKKFIKDMMVHHQGAVEMARLAQRRSTKEEIRALSADIISAQTKEISLMKQWMIEWFPQN